MKLRGLNMPAALAASVLASGCPAGDDGDTGAETTSNTATDASSSGSSSSGPSTSASTSASTSTSAGTDDSTGTDETTTLADSSGSEGSSGDTGEPVDCETVDNATCPMTPGCVIHPDVGICVADCAMLEDQASCMQEVWCEWLGTECDFGPLE